MNWNKLLLFLFCANVSFAQNTTTGNIKSVAKDGLYVVKIPSELRSYSKQNLENLRIFDSKKQETPYFIFENERVSTFNNFAKLSLVSKSSIHQKKTEVIFENSPLLSNQFILEISNVEASKVFEISGSNDQQNWFGLMRKDSIYFEKDSQKTSIFQSFDIPFNDYKFIKITFDDTKTLPLNVLNVGVIKSLLVENSLEKIKSFNTDINQDKVEKKSIYKIKFNQKTVINQVSFSISNPKLYNREARIYYLETSIGKKNKTIINEIDVLNCTLNPNQTNSFLIAELFVNELIIEIINNDNLQLSIDEISFFQNQKYLVTELKANENYTLETGNKLEAPNYDLKYFEEILNQKLPETSIYNIKHQKTIKANEEKPILQQPWVMWLGIIIGAIVVLYFTMSLVKDMNKSN